VFSSNYRPTTHRLVTIHERDQPMTSRYGLSHKVRRIKMNVYSRSATDEMTCGFVNK